MAYNEKLCKTLKIMLVFLEDSNSSGTFLKCSKYPHKNREIKTANPKTYVQHLQNTSLHGSTKKPQIQGIHLQGICFCEGGSSWASD